MNKDHFDRYFSERYDLIDPVIDSVMGGEEIISGSLVSKSDSTQSTMIVDGLPRFVEMENYGDNFGIQWNKFSQTQLDSSRGGWVSFDRFWHFTKWQPKELYGKRILEVGSGAGRFTEIMLAAGAEVVSFDLSSAVEANRKTNQEKGDVLFFQGDIYNIPFPDESFDFVFCYGVLQHTPDPEKSFKSIYGKLKPSGKISIDWYMKYSRPNWWSTPKYLWRPITTKMDPKKLLKYVEWYIPLWLPIDTLLKKTIPRIPWIGHIILGLVPIPCYNFLDPNYAQRKQVAIMDTYDALGACYDYPKTLDELKDMVVKYPHQEVDVFCGSNGLVANLTK